MNLSNPLHSASEEQLVANLRTPLPGERAELWAPKPHLNPPTLPGDACSPSHRSWSPSRSPSRERAGERAEERGGWGDAEPRAHSAAAQPEHSVLTHPSAASSARGVKRWSVFGEGTGQETQRFTEKRKRRERPFSGEQGGPRTTSWPGKGWRRRPGGRETPQAFALGPPAHSSAPRWRKRWWRPPLPWLPREGKA